MENGRDTQMQVNRGWLSPRWTAALAAYLMILVLIVALAYLGLIPTELGYIPCYDTIGHFMLMGSAAYLAHRALNRRTLRVCRWCLPMGPLLIAALAFGEEGMQMLSPYRTFSLSDMLSDLSGMLFFLWLDDALPPWREVRLLGVVRRFARLLGQMGLSALYPLLVFGGLAVIRGMEGGLLHRYDLLLIAFASLQALMVICGYIPRRDLRAMACFGALGLLLELYKVRSGAWVYPEPGYSKVGGVPLYAVFLYGSVAGFCLQLWRRLRVEPLRWPRSYALLALCLGMYISLLSVRMPQEARLLLILLAGGLLARTRLEFTNTTRRRRLPAIIWLALLSVALWLAENAATFLGAWVYPYQLGGWQMVDATKISSWFLLGTVCLVLIVSLNRPGARQTQAMG